MSIDPNPLEKKQGYAHERTFVTNATVPPFQWKPCLTFFGCKRKTPSHLQKLVRPSKDGVCCPDGKYVEIYGDVCRKLGLA
ncbi:hypothetical protein TNIN_182501 [Trichonephila inaurata madagascariensis]|uniref:Uncharacterized protein n=1 Tax=Trichonephila inaurata madagascariensis TaxID=2747483 RepID=A0A8X6MD58_9ARAC|nr:hypothetical protein TNIN_182501 [Trichonephila inaurata madagascariensis]